MNLRQKWSLGACFFLSGATSLVFEVAWSKELSYILGNTLYAVSTVVAAFMAGLGAGSAVASRAADRFSRPLRAYAVLQFCIGIWGVLSLPLFRATKPLFGELYQSLDPGQGTFLLARFGVVFLLMFVPSMLMGMTLPVVIGAFARGKERYDFEAGTLYGVNTLGAVAGTLGAGFFLVPELGLFRTCLVAGFLDGIAGLVSLWLDRGVGAIRDVRLDPERRRARKPEKTKAHAKPPKSKPTPAPTEELVAPVTNPDTRPRLPWTPRQWLIATIFGLSGLFAMVYEVGWFRLLGLAMGPSVYAFSAMLGVFLAGIGIGSAAAAPWAQRAKGDGLMPMALLEGALGFVTLLSLFYLNALPTTNFHWSRWAVGVFGEPGFAIERLMLAALVVLPPCLIMGMLFPFAVRAIREAGHAEALPEPTVGRLYLFNTAGGIAGSLAAGFWLVPGIGMWDTLRLAGIASVLLGCILASAAGGRGAGMRRGVSVACAVLAVFIVWRTPTWNVGLFTQGIYRETYSHRPYPTARIAEERLLYHREGINATVAVMKSPTGASLYVSGKPDASYYLLDLMTQTLFGHLPVMLAPDPRRVAVVGYGSGMTVGAVLTHPEVRSVDVLEIEDAVIDASSWFEGINRRPFEDPRTRLIVEDGRVHLAYTGAVYDVITSEPSNPWMAGVSNLFTTDFYREVRERLAPGGVFAQFVQAYDISIDAYRGMLASISEVFPHFVVFRSNPDDCIVIASDRPIRIPWERFRSRAEVPAVRASFQRIGITSPLEVPFFLQGPEPAMQSFARATRARNTDDNVWLEYLMPRVLVRAPAAASRESPAVEVARLGSRERMRGIVATFPGIPLDSCVRAIVTLPHRYEPVRFPTHVFSDPWTVTRGVLLEGLAAELAWIGRSDLGDRAVEWDREAEAARLTRIRVTNEIVDAAAAAGPVSPALLDRATAEAPDLPIVNAFQGVAHENRGDLARAEPYYRNVLSHPPSEMYCDAVMGLARIAWSRGDYEGAIAYCELAAARNPFFPSVYTLAARIHAEKGNADRARQTLERGIRFDPGNQELAEAVRALPSR